MENNRSNEEKDVPNHPCHRLSVPLAKLFWCRHCMQTFTDPISRWRHSKECKTETYDKHTKRKSKEAHALQLFAHTSALAECQLRKKSPSGPAAKPRKVPRIDPPDSCDLKCFICHQVFATLSEMREHVKTPCHRPAYEEEYTEEAAEMMQSLEPRIVIVKDGEVVQQGGETVSTMESLVPQDQYQNFHTGSTEWVSPMELLAQASRVQSTTENALAAQSIAQDSRNSQLQQTVMKVERNLNSSALNDNFPMELLVQATEMLQPNSSGSVTSRVHSSVSTSILNSGVGAVKVEPVPGNLHQSSSTSEDKLPMELLVQASELMQTSSGASYTTAATASTSTTTEMITQGTLVDAQGQVLREDTNAEDPNAQKTYYHISEAVQEAESTEVESSEVPVTAYKEQSFYVTGPDGTRERIIIQAATGEEEVVEEEEFTIDPSSAQTVAIPVDSDGNPIKLENMELLTEGEDGSGQEIVYVVVM